MKKIKQKIVRENTDSGSYTVVKFLEDNNKIFDCIPDIWFKCEDQDSCYWPPSKGKNIAIRALKQEPPEESWEVYPCEVVQKGFATYSAGRAFVREKYLQVYNTSRTDEHIEAVKFRRQHPALSYNNSPSFENIFPAKKSDRKKASRNCSENTSTDFTQNLESDIVQEGRSSPTLQSHLGQGSSSKLFKRSQSVKSASCIPSSVNRNKRSPMSRNSNDNLTSDCRARRSHSGESTCNKRSSMSCDSNDNRASRYRARRSQSGESTCNKRSWMSCDSNDNSASSYRARRSQSGKSPCNIPSPMSRNSNNNRTSSCHDSGESICNKRSPMRCDSNDNRARRSTRSKRGESNKGGRSDASTSKTRSFRSPLNDPCIKRTRSRISQVELQRKDCGTDLCVRDQCPKNVLKELRDLTKTVVHYQHQNDRRLSRMEVSVNKTLVRIGDIIRSNDVRSTNDLRETSRGYSAEVTRHENSQDCSGGKHYEHGQRKDARDTYDARRLILPKDRKCPEFPIGSLNEINDTCKQLKDEDFFLFLMNREKEFCMPSKNMSINRVVTAYLKRFVSVWVRSLITLKQESKDGDGFTLYGDFRKVYDFLIAVIREAYGSSKKSLTENEAHESLRVVWGRSKQLLKDDNKKRNK